MPLQEILAIVSAAANLGLLIVALVAWRTAERALAASRSASESAAAMVQQSSTAAQQQMELAHNQAQQASSALAALTKSAEASERSAAAAELRYNQAALDGIARTRPYVYAVVVPGLWGIGFWDVKISNVGQSSAIGLTMEFDAWPARQDYLTDSVKTLFTTVRSIPPGTSVRAAWSCSLPGEPEEGMGSTGIITVRYSSEDPAKPQYHEQFDVMTTRSGLIPLPEDGPNNPKDSVEILKVIARHIAELRR